MADKSKRIFQIEINGVKETLDAVKSLNDALKDTESIIKGLQNAKVDIKVSSGDIDTEPKKTKVSSTKDSASRQELAIERELEKAAALTNDQYTERLRYLEQIKAENKEAVNEQKNIAKGVKDINGEWANTLAGQRAYLSSLKKELANIDFDVEPDKFKDLSDEILRVNTNVKKMEQAYGDFYRNVGNYPDALGDKFKALAVKVEQAGNPNTLGGLKELKRSLEELIDVTETSNPKLDEYIKKLEEVTDTINNLSGKDIRVRAEDIIDTKFTTTLNGMKLEFDDINQGVGVLEDKLYQLALQGRQNTKEFKNIQDQIIKMRQAVISTDAAIDNMVKGSRGLNNVISVFQGFAGISGIGQGFMGLFGRQSEEIDKMLQKFTSLSLVLQGVQAVQEQLRDKTSAFTQTYTFLGNVAEKIITPFSNLFNVMGDLATRIPLVGTALKKVIEVASVGKYQSFANQFQETCDAMEKLINQTTDLKRAYESLSNDDVLAFAFADDLSDASDELKNFIQVLDNLKDSNPELASQLDDLIVKWNEQADQYADFAEELKGYGVDIKRFAAEHQGLAQGLGKVVTGFKMATAAVKAFAKATVIFAIIQAAIWALEKAIDSLVYGWNKLAEATGISSRAQVDAAKVLENQIQRTNEKLEKQIELQEELTRTGKQSIWQQQANEVKAYEQSIVEAGNELKRFISTLDEANKEPLTDNLQSVTSWGWFSTDRIKDLDEFRKKYDILVKAVAAGTDKVAQGGEGWGWWNTAADAVDDLGKAQRAVIKDLNLQLSKIDYSNAEQATKQFRKLIDDEMYASALANIEDLFPEEQWAKNLKALVDQYKQFGGDLKKVNVEIAASMNNALRTIEQNNIAAIQQRFKREREELENQYKWERKEAEGNAALVASIDNKYNTMRLNLKKQQAREIQDVNYQIRENEIAAEKDGLDKRLKELQLAKEREIAQAVASEIEVGRQKEAIEKKYAKLILDAKKEFTKNVVEIEKKTTEEILKAQAERNRAMMDLELQYLRQEEDLQERIAELRRQTAGTELETQNISATSEISYDVNVSGEDGLKQQMEYFNKLLEQQKKYNEAKKALDIETAKAETEQQKTSEERRYEDSIQSLKDFKETQTETLKEHLKEQLITQEEYDKEIKELEEVYNESINKEYTQHYELLDEITRNGEANINKIISDYNEINKNNVATALSSNIGAYSDYYDEIGELAEKNFEKNHNKFGILNYKKEKKNLEDTKSEYQDLLKGIETQYEALQKALENKEISFNDFEKAKGELDDLKESVNDSLKTVNSDLSTLLGRVGESIVQMSMQYVNAFQDIWSSMDNLFSISYDQQEMKLEAEQELLDEELEMIEEQYEKQEEITQKHKDKIDSIEDELGSARGDRREALLDQLAKERAAQLKSLETEQEIQKKKEQNERKQEALKKKQEQLEKKRWQQQKRNDIVNATISTFTGAANALKVQPIWAGIALAATVTALGLANVAKIASQKFYAKGGLLTGPSHAQGGIPVGLTGIEVEGNEYVVNKQTTSKNLPLLEYVNSQKRTLTKEDLVSFYDNGETKLVNNTVQKKFAQGGQLPQMEQFDLRSLINYQQPEDNRQIVVSVVDIINSQENLRRVQTLSGVE